MCVVGVVAVVAAVPAAANAYVEAGHPCGAVRVVSPHSSIVVHPRIPAHRHIIGPAGRYGNVHWLCVGIVIGDRIPTRVLSRGVLQKSAWLHVKNRRRTIVYKIGLSACTPELESIEVLIDKRHHDRFARRGKDLVTALIKRGPRYRHLLPLWHILPLIYAARLLSTGCLLSGTGLLVALINGWRHALLSHLLCAAQGWRHINGLRVTAS